MRGGERGERTRADHARVADAFDALCDLGAAERARRLRELERDDPALADEVRRLLDADASGADGLDGSALEASGLDSLRPVEPGRPSAVGPFHVLGELGRGGMGVVLLAEQDSPRRRVALKLLRHGLLTSELAARFAREADVLARLDHPAVVRVWQTGLARVGDEERAYIAMELVDGEPITTWARRTDAPPRARLAILAEVAEAVQHAHEAGVVHRDLKPSNVLVDRAGRPRVLDFGVARVVDPARPAATAVTSTGEIVGTLSYMSPEQVGGDADRVDARSDVYALGVVAYELLSGARPYDVAGVPLHAAARVVVEAEPPPLGRLDARLAGDVETIVARALEKDPLRRYASAAELAADLRAHLDHRPIAARPVTRVYRAAKFARRHRALVAGTAAVLVTLVAGLAATAWKARQASVAAQRAEERMERALEVSRLLGAFFTSVDPEVEGPDARVLHMIERSEGILDDAAGRAPLVDAALHHALGSAWAAIGDERRAERHLLRSLAAREEHGAEPWELAESLETLGRMRSGAGDTGPAETRALLERAADLRERAHGDAHPATLTARLALAEHDRDYGDRGEGLAAMQRVLAALERVEPPGGEARLSAQRRVAAALAEDGRFDAAEALLRSALDEVRSAFGERHLRTARVLAQLGDLHVEQGRFADAELALDAALDAASEHLPEDHPDHAGLLSRLGALLRGQGRHAEASAVYERRLAIVRAARDEPSRALVRALADLAGTALELREVDRARALMDEAVAIEDSGVALTSEERTLLQEALGILASWRGDLDAALVHQHEVNRLLRASADANPLELANGLLNEGVVLRRLGRPADALDPLREALALELERRGPDHPYTAQARFEVAGALQSLGRDEESLPLALAAVAVYREHLGGGTWEHHLAVMQTADALLRLERWERLDELLEAEAPPRDDAHRRAGHAYVHALARTELDDPAGVLAVVDPVLDAPEGVEEGLLERLRALAEDARAARGE